MFLVVGKFFIGKQLIDDPALGGRREASRSHAMNQLVWIAKQFRGTKFYARNFLDKLYPAIEDVYTV